MKTGQLLARGQVDLQSVLFRGIVLRLGLRESREGGVGINPVLLAEHFAGGPSSVRSKGAQDGSETAI